MNVLTEIISLLSNERESLTNGLYKLKILASRIKNNELLNWINKELNGYEDEDVLPNYRVGDVLLKGTYINQIGHSIPDQPIPAFKFSERLEYFAKKINITQGISIIENIANSEDDSISYSVPAELGAIITNIIREYNPTARRFNLINLHRVVSVISYKNILIKVRNHALELALALEVEMGYEVEIEEIIKNKGEANQIIHNYMTQNITNIGDGNSITIGNNNKIDQNLNIQKGDFNQLKNELSQLGLEDHDIDDLQEVLESEKDNNESEQLGKKTQGWIRRMGDKLIKNGKKIGVEFGITTLTAIIRAYLGI
ncbi:hypothetical protein [Proteiniphilum sp.]|uniref:AbiTii domain-containing protein n=1 Tax=Proteiniphilum sp. TaxID=1926877 RepID=UPI002B1FB9F2|nr:hypothetical protein [Proteiniphilum sp.]MEA4916304.1 hypothetical protein [Proteiniphilum sp.]